MASSPGDRTNTFKIKRANFSRPDATTESYVDKIFGTKGTKSVEERWEEMQKFTPGEDAWFPPAASTISHTSLTEGEGQKGGGFFGDNIITGPFLSIINWVASKIKQVETGIDEHIDAAPHIKILMKMSVVSGVMLGVHLYYSYRIDAEFLTLYPDTFQDVNNLLIFISEHLQTFTSDLAIDIEGGCRFLAGRDGIWQAPNMTMIQRPFWMMKLNQEVGTFLFANDTFKDCWDGLKRAEQTIFKDITDQLTPLMGITAADHLFNNMNKYRERRTEFESTLPALDAPEGDHYAWAWCGSVLNFFINDYKGLAAHALDARNLRSWAAQKYQTTTIDFVATLGRIMDQGDIGLRNLLRAEHFLLTWCVTESFLIITFMIPLLYRLGGNPTGKNIIALFIVFLFFWNASDGDEEDNSNYHLPWLEEYAFTMGARNEPVHLPPPYRDGALRVILEEAEEDAEMGGGGGKRKKKKRTRKHRKKKKKKKNTRRRKNRKKRQRTRKRRHTKKHRRRHKKKKRTRKKR